MPEPGSTRDERSYWSRAQHLDYHSRQYETPYRSTVALGHVVAATLPDTTAPLRALDVGCGGGANIHYLRSLLPNATWLGVDLVPESILFARQTTATAGLDDARFEFREGDFYALESFLEAHTFDVVLSIQTLSWIEKYERALEQLLKMVAPGGYAFVTSLFTDYRVDATTVVTQYEDDRFNRSISTHYNVYALERFAQICRSHGAVRVEATDFVIDTDLAPPNDLKMGTYTRRLTDGTLLQFSGPLLMPWKIVVVAC